MSGIRKLFTHTKKVLFFGPELIFRGLGKLNENLQEDRDRVKANKIRPPRFVNFRMELESYNEQKALALQILNDINLNVFVSETIDRIFDFHWNTLILTGKRLILAQAIKKKGESSEQKVVYKTWNILYRDIMLVSVILFDIKRNCQISNAELDQMIEDKGMESKEVMSITMVIKILYHQGGQVGDLLDIDDEDAQKRQRFNNIKSRMRTGGQSGIGIES